MKVNNEIPTALTASGPAAYADDSNNLSHHERFNFLCHCLLDFDCVDTHQCFASEGKNGLGGSMKRQFTVECS